MTEPFQDGDDDRLSKLYKLLAASRAHTQRLEELVAEELGESIEAVHQRRRAAMHVVRWVPGLAGALVLIRKVLGDPRTVAVMSATTTAVVAGAITFAVIRTTPDYTTSAPATSVPALPPIGHKPPHIGPLKRHRPTPAGPVSSPRQAPGVTSSPVPIVAVPSLPPVTVPPSTPDPTPTHKPKHKHKPKPKKTKPCQLDLPVLDWCLPLDQLSPE